MNCTYPIENKKYSETGVCGKAPVIAYLNRATGQYYNLCTACAEKLKSQGYKVHYYNTVDGVTQ